MFYKVINNRRFVVVHKIKKINFVNILTIADIVNIVEQNQRVLKFY